MAKTMKNKAAKNILSSNQSFYTICLDHFGCMFCKTETKPCIARIVVMVLYSYQFQSITYMLRMLIQRNLTLYCAENLFTSLTHGLMSTIDKTFGAWSFPSKYI